MTMRPQAHAVPSDVGPILSACRDETASYPTDDAFSPDEAYPEYSYGDAPGAANAVYRLVRDCLRLSGADVDRYGFPDWNPLSRWIRSGDRVFVMPNLVADRRPDETLDDFLSKCTHGSVVRAVCDYAAIAAGGIRHVVVGNAPIQSCDHRKVVEQTGLDRVQAFYERTSGHDIGPLDLRAVITRWTRFGALIGREEHGDNVVIVDLGTESFLEELYRKPASDVDLGLTDELNVRVGDYDPRVTMSYHSRGHHRYAVDRRVLESDVIVSVPKLKTHNKVGITCAVKGTVGSITHKECLAHHRRGGPGHGGDEFPHTTPFHEAASWLLDRAAMSNADLLGNVTRIASKLLYRTLRVGPGNTVGGSWHGNNTAWRMALDIARILRYARSDGSLADEVQREHIAFVDGIVGGEGEGPLHPRARPVGILMFGSDPAWTDYGCALAMGFDPSLIPTVTHSLAPMRYPLSVAPGRPPTTFLNGVVSEAWELGELIQPGFEPPKGWARHLARTPRVV